MCWFYRLLERARNCDDPKKRNGPGQLLTKTQHSLYFRRFLYTYLVHLLWPCPKGSLFFLVLFCHSLIRKPIHCRCLQVRSRMDHVEDHHCKNHKRPVKHAKIWLVRDYVSVPALRKLHGTIEVPDDDARFGKAGSEEQKVIFDAHGTERACQITQRNNMAKTHMEISWMIISAIISCVPFEVLVRGLPS